METGELIFIIVYMVVVINISLYNQKVIIKVKDMESKDINAVLKEENINIELFILFSIVGLIIVHKYFFFDVIIIFIFQSIFLLFSFSVMKRKLQTEIKKRK